MKTIESRLCPLVDSPCSTPPEFARGQVSAFCSGCQKTVYNLSAMTAPAQAQLLTRTENPCVRYRKILPAAALAMALSSAANSAEVVSVPDNETLITIVGGGGVYLEPMFLKSELDPSLDDIDAHDSENGAKK